MHRCPAPRVRDAVARRHIARDRGRARRRGADAARKRCEQNSSARCATREGDARDATRATRRRRWTNTFRERAGTREARRGDATATATAMRARGGRGKTHARWTRRRRAGTTRARAERANAREAGGWRVLQARGATTRGDASVARGERDARGRKRGRLTNATMMMTIGDGKNSVVDRRGRRT